MLTEKITFSLKKKPVFLAFGIWQFFFWNWKCQRRVSTDLSRVSFGQEYQKMTEQAVEALKDDPELKELNEGWKMLK